MRNNINELINDPGSYFKSPDEVYADSSLTTEQKIEILRQWEYDTRELEVAEEENMSGGPPNMLHEILETLRKLGAKHDSEHPSPTKQH